MISFPIVRAPGVSSVAPVFTGGVTITDGDLTLDTHLILAVPAAATYPASAGLMSDGQAVILGGNPAGATGFIFRPLGINTATGEMDLATTGVLTLSGQVIVKAGGAKIVGLGAFAAGDHYVLAAADGTFHLSALGPAS